MDRQQRIAVIGGGSWATAIVKMLSNNSNQILWWIRNNEVVEFINKYSHNPNYLSAVEIDLSKVELNSSINEIFNQADIIILAIPSAFIDETLSRVKPEFFKDKVFVSAVKGIVPEYNQVIGEYLNSKFFVSYNNILAISGPCHAEEVALEKLSYLTIACSNLENAVLVSNLLSCRYIKCSISEDIIGVEYAAVLKNIYAIASGICHGLGYGDNFQAVLVANVIQEMEHIVQVINPMKRDIKHSAYLGDLLVTSYSQFSRNRVFGNMLGKGYSVKSAQFEMNMIAEGYYAVKCLIEMNKRYEINMPICRAVYNIIYERISPAIEIKLLTERLK
ncbi:MAG: NAD(P)H-dependent glycerol-3-phosphate dehydrogenase [Bacteroidia bacterium]|nr:NAD(P)H-dependent glycerol-3-phosphate dehydrogenase [Bacteroidia bacterium]MCZ2248266.1 NAD(P)H-dependent glycerol-3-phosphate dehydrogenase [Bacteroidia bacterium]